MQADEREGARTVALDEGEIELPDLLTELQDRTQLTRRTIHRVLADSGRLDDFKRNPQAFIELAGEAINRRKRLAAVDGIKYERLGDDHYYAQELFEEEELTGYLKNMLTGTKKSVYEQVVYDSGTEAAFADGMEKNEAVKLYAKLPGWFTVRTPLGPYNPDWAVLVEQDGLGSACISSWRPRPASSRKTSATGEGAKIACGKAHFRALEVREAPPRYLVARSVADVLDASG